MSSNGDHAVSVVVVDDVIVVVASDDNDSNMQAAVDALPSHGVKPTWGFHKVKLRKVELGSMLPASNSRKG